MLTRTYRGNDLDNFKKGEILSERDEPLDLTWEMYGNRGDDTLIGANLNDTIYGGTGNDSLSGGLGNDELRGQEGTDFLDGGSGNDLVRGYGYSSSEYDTLTGASGGDTFDLGDGNPGNFTVFYRGLGFARITDFNEDAGDKIELVGNESDYSLEYSNFYGSSDLDTLIRYQGDLIAVVQDNSSIDECAIGRMLLGGAGDDGCGHIL